MRKNKGSILLLITAFIWGSAFVAQSVGNDIIKPFTFNCLRSVIGAISLIPVFIFMNKKYPKKYNYNKSIKTGILSGLALTIGTNLQQVGLVYTEVGKAGFISALYILFVPLLGIFFFKNKVDKKLWISIIIAIIGFYFLSIFGNSFILELGDSLILLCSVFFALQILIIDKFVKDTNVILVSITQFTVVSILTGFIVIYKEPINISNIKQAWFPLLYTGMFSSGIAYTFQIFGQRDTDPTVASLIMSLESVFAVITAFIILSQKLLIHELFGCVLIFIAIVISQLPKRRTN
jgi:drug/metabolite transporter (DMT)-like permease